MKFSVKGFFRDLVIFTEGILNGKLHFLCSVIYWALNGVVYVSSADNVNEAKFSLLYSLLLLPNTGVFQWI